MTAFTLNLFGKDYRQNFRTLLTPQTAILGITNKANDTCNFPSHVLLVFNRYYIVITY